MGVERVRFEAQHFQELGAVARTEHLAEPEFVQHPRPTGEYLPQALTSCQHLALSHALGTFRTVTKPYGGSADGLNARQRRRRRIGKRSGYSKYRPLLVQMQKGLCGLCSRKLPEDMGRVEVDHIVRVRDGGNSAIDNLQAVHRSCNQRKG